MTSIMYPSIDLVPNLPIEDALISLIFAMCLCHICIQITKKNYQPTEQVILNLKVALIIFQPGGILLIFVKSWHDYL